MDWLLDLLKCSVVTAVDVVSETAEATADVVSETAEAAVDVVSETAEATADVVFETAEATADVVFETAEAAAETILYTITKTADTIKTIEVFVDRVLAFTITNVSSLKESIFDYIDQNGTGKIDTEDFTKMLKNYIDISGDEKINFIDILTHKAIYDIGAEVSKNYGVLAKIGAKTTLRIFIKV